MVFFVWFLVDEAVVDTGIEVVYDDTKLWNAVVVLFGAYELTRKIQRQPTPPPVILFSPW
jgi:hypothetical protein